MCIRDSLYFEVCTLGRLKSIFTRVVLSEFLRGPLGKQNYTVKYFCGLASLLLLVVFVPLAQADRTLKDSLSKEIASFEKRFPKAKVAFSLKTLGRNSRTVHEHQPNTLLKPASVVKLLTAAAAFRILGSEYRFPTEVFFQAGTAKNPNADSLGLDVSSSRKRANSASGRLPSLYIRGYGDPGLVDEDLFLIARKIAEYGISEIEALYLSLIHI